MEESTQFLPDEIKSVEEIQQLVKEGFTEWSRYGYVTVRAYQGLLIFNYNTMAQYDGRWNFFEKVSRGLILNSKTGEIVARPFDKFFNWFEKGRRAKGHIVTVTEKLDGSIGILYRLKGKYRIATRGSFTSNQAEWATAFLNDHFDLTDLPNELTLLFEILYPDNRIVIDYQGREDLVLLAARNRHTGEYLPFFPDTYELAQQYGFSLPEVFHFNDVTTLLEQTGAIDFEQEGYVVEFSDGSRYKFKGDRYLELHRLITGLTFKNVLGAMASGNVRQILDVVPDEFLTETRGWIEEINRVIEKMTTELRAAFAAAPKESRKDFAVWVQKNHPKIANYLYSMFDDRDIVPLIYQYYDWGHQDKDDESDDV